MKKLLFIIILLSLFACDEVLIEENRRIEVRGSLTSSENEPVSGIQVLSVGSRERQLTSNTDKILGRGYSSENGDFNFISLDTYTHDIILAVNPVEIDHNEAYSSLYFYDPSGDHSSSYDLEEIEIARRLEFQFRISHTSQAIDTLRYVLEFQRPVQNFLFVDGEFVEQESDGSNFISLREHRPGSEPLTHTLPIRAGTDLVFRYNIGENPVEEIIIPVSTDNNSFDFEY